MGTNDWKIIKTISNTSSFFEDTSAQKNISYCYALRSIDMHNNVSKLSNPVCAQLTNSGVLMPVTNLKGIVKEGKIILSWDYTSVDKETYFTIYKMNGNGNLLMHQTTTVNSFTELIGSTKNEYAVKVKRNDGAQSKLSETITIKSN